jgi:pimeloyl-ACP methyl ester carboxylesterase
MNSNMGPKIEAELKPGSWFCGFVRNCKFDLHYFFGSYYDGPEPGKSDYNKKKPLILFISGGPGEIVDRETPYFHALTQAKLANVVYFDVRGTGFSVIPESNDYDEFLRAEYVAEDIETLRKTLMNECDFDGQRNCKTGVTPWDAIYATSWGTIVAQQYAAKYGKGVRGQVDGDKRNRNRVKKLILEAPVSRGHRDTEEARREMIVGNLLDIFDKHRTMSKCLWDPDDPVVKHALGISWPELRRVENFCFLTKQKSITKNQKPIIENIKDAFKKLLDSIETKYGSVNFVISFYDQFRNDDTDFWKNYPYPREFFEAIRELEDFGAGKLPKMSIDEEVERRKVGTAMYLAYYLWLPQEALTDTSNSLHPGNGEFLPKCNADADFFSALQDSKNLKSNFCDRIRKAWDDLHFKRPSSFNRSARARSVFSVHDGLAQWIFEIMKNERRVDHQGCFAGKEIQDIVKEDSQLQAVVINSKVIKEQARRLGIKATEKVCPWDPARVNEYGECENCHDVDTLILKGGADPITAGDQAEYLFEKALAPTKRALIEFPGVGHTMNYQLATEDQKPDRLDKVIDDFNGAVIGSKIANDPAYKALLEELKERRAVERRVDSSAVRNSLKDLIIGFVTSKTVDGFTQNDKATTAIGTLGGCLRTEDNEKFVKCICELTEDKHQVCKILTEVVKPYRGTILQ